MIGKCLRGMMPRLSAVWNHRFLSSTVGQTFSVVNHQTFGYIFNSNDDLIMKRLKNLNNFFALKYMIFYLVFQDKETNKFYN